MIENKPYELSRLLNDFPVSDLAKGAEWLLSETPNTMTQYPCLGYPEPRYGHEMPQDICRGADPIRIFFKSSPAAGRSRDAAIEAEICLDQKWGRLLYSRCSCFDFHTSKYCCKHITGIGLAYTCRKTGYEALRGTAVEKELRELTQVADPLIPGSLRHTTDALLTLVKKNSGKSPKLDKPAWVTGAKGSAANALSADIRLIPCGEKALVELQVGPKKHYVIRNIPQLLTAYREGGKYAFSTTVECSAGASSYDEKSREVMDVLSEINAYGERLRKGLGFNDYYSTEKGNRQMGLGGWELDRLMEALAGKKVTVGEKEDAILCQVDLEREPEKIRLEKSEFGAYIRSAEEQMVGRGMKQLYIRQGDRIMSLPEESWEQRQVISKAAREGELYIQEKDLPAICRVLADDSMENQLEVVGMNLIDYIREKPHFQIYLDYPQQGLVSCKALAIYDGAGKSYSVFNQKKDKAKRNLAMEQPVGETLWSYFDAYDDKESLLYKEVDDADLYTLLTEGIPAMAALGEVLVSDAIKRLKVRKNPDVQVGINVEEGALTMSLKSNSLSKEEMIELLSSYNRKKHFTRLKNGEFLVVNEEEAAIWEAISETFRSYGKKNPEAMKIPMFRALYLDELLKDRDAFSLEEADAYRNLVRQLTDADYRNYVLPAQLEAIMRPYQKEGFRWMSMLKDYHFGGILADDMGLGKTLQVLAYVLAQKQAGKTGDQLRTLIVAPASLVYNWEKEIHRFTPELTARVVAGSLPERKRILGAIPRRAAEETSPSETSLSETSLPETIPAEDIPSGEPTVSNGKAKRGRKPGKKAEVESAEPQGQVLPDIYITSYDLLKRDIDLYEDIAFANQIIDEAQYIKNPGTQVAKAVRLIHSDFRMALTGTPIENRLSELWSIFDYLMPGFLYAYARFHTDYESPIVTDQDQEVLNRLRQLVHPFILRRLKKEVLQELPDKLEEVITVRLEGEQRKLYDAYATRLRMFLAKQTDEEFKQSKLEILKELMQIRQICCGPDLFLDNYKGPNAKLDACAELVNQAIEGGHKLLIFSQFTSVLDQIGKRLAGEKIAYYRIDGSVSKEKRMELVDAFQTDDTPVFCISLKAGGTGLNLTAADIVIHYDPWWNSAAMNQATDRAHRIGQENTVTVYQLIAEETIEEQILHLQQAKAQLADDILTGEGVGSTSINREELLSIMQ